MWPMNDWQPIHICPSFCPKSAGHQLIRNHNKDKHYRKLMNCFAVPVAEVRAGDGATLRLVGEKGPSKLCLDPLKYIFIKYFLSPPMYRSSPHFALEEEKKILEPSPRECFSQDNLKNTLEIIQYDLKYTTTAIPALEHNSVLCDGTILAD